ncbi:MULTISPECIES: DUF4878 domain-containing protein [unclassified Campylobacter]|uniref:DUF4878 domain-containing protein n=1 Tax=unclassified Campylobacter TaxID=2593542 RepID=UPI0012381117|nr:DUF4878 domain-containing protein [Campylobacter sp. LR185c]KAA6225753.1 DUF4878 domain-containing protein [Campylobacter sp. LR286c]KAA6225873.1 DUF4878 domain-containing protein [Campylobacter sp. LR196d]KAA6229726.1 DUF4878 domain-containing protein [Campylobacter sp. LR291e]KAA8603992.1 hypothetical protein CGP82_04970 [Campylobacter sp. LR185c]
MKKEVEKKGGFKSIEILDEKIYSETDTAVVKVRVIFKDGSSGDESYTLHKTKNGWKINMNK